MNKTLKWYSGVYFIADLIVHYYFVVKHDNLDQLMANATTQNETLHEMMKWSVTNEGSRTSSNK